MGPRFAAPRHERSVSRGSPSESCPGSSCSPRWRSTRPARPTGASGATARRTTRWRVASPSTGTSSSPPPTSPACASSYPGGPQGVFLKRVGVDSGAPRLVYAKALAYPVVAAPLARLFGVDRGLLLLNALVFVAALWLGYAELSRASGAGVAAAGALAVLAGGVVPVYLLWPTPEIFNLGLATFGLVAFRRGRWVLAAVLLGLAAYSKPTNLALALPLLLEPLTRGGAAGTWPKRVIESARRGAVVAAVVAAGFGLSWVATGAMNYQGGERKTFYDRYPFDPGVTFDSAGVWMTTDHLGPLVAGRDEDGRARASRRLAPPRSCGGPSSSTSALSGSAVSAAPCRTSPGSRRRWDSSCSWARGRGTAGWPSPHSSCRGSATSS